MPAIDLITGFLGSGKTTLLRRYAQYLISQGQNIGILENDYGAVNVDMMLLSDLEGDRCELEMVSGGCDYDCHRRRFKTKLIAMGMCGYDRVLVEPSGVFDVDEFFDVLCEEPLDGWYRIGNVITVVNASLEDDMSEQSDYLLAAQAAKAGRIVLSRAGSASGEQRQAVAAHLNRALRRFGCTRDVSGIILPAEIPDLTDSELQELASCGYAQADHVKLPVMEESTFSSVYYMNRGFRAEEVKELVRRTFADPACGGVFRIKGFLPPEGETDAGTALGEQNGGTKKSGWTELNATRDELTEAEVPAGQDVLIIIGEDLNREAICRIWGTEGLA